MPGVLSTAAARTTPATMRAAEAVPGRRGDPRLCVEPKVTIRAIREEAAVAAAEESSTAPAAA
jgi:hypothetical protein